jgi:hypothetical protein
MPTPTYTPLATVTLGSTASSVTFSSIPATYRDLIVVLSVRSTRANDLDFMAARLNGDGGTNYSDVNMFGDPNNSTNSQSGSGATYLNMVNIDAASRPAGTFSPVVLQIMDYSATDKHKTYLIRGNQISYPEARAGRWASTSAVSSIVVSVPYNSAQFATGTTLNLFGVIA